MSSLKSLLYWPQLDVFMLRVVMWQYVVMSCCLYWVILEEHLSVCVLASAVDDCWFLINFNLWRWSCACVGIDNWVLKEDCNMELYKLVNCSGSQYSSATATAFMILTYFFLIFLCQFLQLILVRQINLIKLPSKVKYVSICICLCLL